MGITAAQPPISTRSTETLLAANGLSKSFRMGEAVVQVLKHADISIKRGEFVAIEGRSGSGKSTLLHLLGALDEAQSGVITYGGNDLASLPSSQRCRIRNEEFGFVFQFYHLLPELNVLENTLLASMVKFSWFDFRSNKARLKQRAIEVLESLSMSHRLTHRPSQLSGGERQRVAIARALMNQPKVLFADEPTGNLDAETGKQIMGVLEKLHREGQTIVMVTHDRTVAKQADRILVLREGKLVAAADA